MTSVGTTRRDVLRMGGGAIALTAWPASAGEQSIDGARVRGVVFEDRSGAGVRQPADPGVSGALVSNGREVVRTDAFGRYELPVEDECAIFVIKPAGWSVPLDPATKLPRFYCLHQPMGSPASLALRYAGVAPTGALPGSLDFPLRRANESAKFDVLMLADPQPADLAELDFLRESFFDAIAATPAAFGVTLGDVMSDNLDLYGRYNELIGQVGAPWWNIPGNHDLNYEATDRRYCRETWKRVFGPAHFAIEHGETTFIMLDNVDWRRDASGSSAYAGRIGETQLDFVRNLLAHTPRERLIVVCMHIPLMSSEPTPSCTTSDRNQLLSLLGDRPAVSFSGHMHTAEHHYLPRPDGELHHHQVLTAVSGSWWSGPFGADGLPLAQCSDGAPNGFHVLSIEGTRWSTRLVSREAANMRVMVSGAASRERSAPSRLTARAGENGELLVNVFDGGPRCHVHTNFVGGARISLSRVARPDPFTCDVFTRHASDIKAWVSPCNSSHLWAAPLPALEPGFHRLSVEAQDEFGRKSVRTLVIEVTV